jgi:hypothetical protein
MKTLSLLTFRFAYAAIAGLAVQAPAYAFPEKLTRPEILKAAIAAPIPEQDLSVVVVIPDTCASSEDEAKVCKQFKEFAPGEKNQFSYATVSNAAKRRSIAGQVQVLPESARARRFIMLIDWKFATQTVDRRQATYAAHLNGEVVVYDQVEKKVVWHALRLASVMSVGSFASFAKSYVIGNAVYDLNRYGAAMEYAAAKGIRVLSLDAKPAPGAYNLVMFNRREDDRVLNINSRTATVTVELASDSHIMPPLSIEMPSDTHVAFSLPPGKYRVSHSWKRTIDVEPGVSPAAYVLKTERSEPYFQIEPVTTDAVADLRASSRNAAVPDPVARNRYSGALAWADVPPAAEPTQP